MLVSANLNDNILTFTAEMLFELHICLVFNMLVSANLDNDLLTFTTKMLFELDICLDFYNASAIALRQRSFRLYRRDTVQTRCVFSIRCTSAIKLRQ